MGRLKVGPHGYSPDMTAPEGQSTGGGVQAMQHLRLLPPEASMPTLLVGHANQRDGNAELRTWEHVDALCRERFNQGAPLDPAQYEQFLQSAQGFLAACGLRVSVAPTPEEMFVRRTRRMSGPAGGRADPSNEGDAIEPSRGRAWPWIVVAGGLALAVAVAAWMLVVAK
ncbi:MAG TPA: hypothetical protein VH044_03160 [Polyangiaceae bacterium]|nr:hypothetical protein [Polyangiaceae bacterium]